MRRNRWEVVLGALVLAAALAGPVFAQEPRVVVNGQPVDFADQQPIERNGRVYIPLRGVLERLGVQTIEWRPAREEVYVASDGREALLHIGSHRAVVNDNAVELDAPPILVAGRTLVPLRFVSESMGATVQWDAVRQTAYVIAPQARVAGEREVYPPERRPERTEPSERSREEPREAVAGPVIRPLRPLPDETVYVRRPEIIVRLRGRSTPIDLNSVRMRVNGQDVTSDLEIRGNQVTYRPAEELDLGRVHVEVTVRDRQGHAAVHEWSFTER